MNLRNTLGIRRSSFHHSIPRPARCKRCRRDNRCRVRDDRHRCNKARRRRNKCHHSKFGYPSSTVHYRRNTVHRRRSSSLGHSTVVSRRGNPCLPGSTPTPLGSSRRCSTQRPARCKRCRRDNRYPVRDGKTRCSKARRRRNRRLGHSKSGYLNNTVHYRRNTLHRPGSSYPGRSTAVCRRGRFCRLRSTPTPRRRTRRRSTPRPTRGKPCRHHNRCPVPDGRNRYSKVRRRRNRPRHSRSPCPPGSTIRYRRNTLHRRDSSSLGRSIAVIRQDKFCRPRSTPTPRRRTPLRSRPRPPRSRSPRSIAACRRSRSSRRRSNALPARRRRRCSIRLRLRSSCRRSSAGWAGCRLFRRNSNSIRVSGIHRHSTRRRRRSSYCRSTWETRAESTPCRCRSKCLAH